MIHHEDEVQLKTYDSTLMRRLFKYARPIRKYLVLAVILLLINSGLAILGPYLTKIGIDRYILAEDINGLAIVGMIYLGVLLLAGGINFGHQVLTTWIGQRLMYDLRMDIFSHLQHLPLSFYDRNPAGRLMTRVTNDVQALNNLFTSGIVAAFGDLFMLTGIIAVMINLNWKLTLVALCTLPLLAIATLIFKTKVRATERKIRVLLARINSFLQENITGMPVVQLFNREEKNFREFDARNREYLDAYKKNILYYAIFYPTVKAISALAVALVVWYGGGQVIRDALTFGSLVAFIMYVEMFFRPISDLAEKYGILQTAMASSERIFNLLDERDELAEIDRIKTNGAQQPIHFKKGRVDGEIEFREVSFSYTRDEQVLREVSFHIRAGETVAIVGATGAGKSTIISLLSRFYTPQLGKILIDGCDISRLPLIEVRQQIGLVLQDVFLFADTIEENIRLGNQDISSEVVQKAAAEVNAGRFIERLPRQYQEMLIERGNSLSVGQKQLIAFARALAYDPPILVLDEATSSVDTETEILIQEALERLMAGRTSVIIAHRLSTIQHADRIIVLHKGRVRESGTHKELLALGGIYSRLYQLQFAFQDREEPKVAV